MHFCGPAWWLGFVGSQTSAVPAAGSSLPPWPCTKQRGVSKVAFQRPACLERSLSLVGTGIFRLKQESPLHGNPSHASTVGPSEPCMSPSGKQRSSRVYLPSKVKFGLDRQRKVITRQILFRGQQYIHNLLKLSLVLCHLLLPAIHLRRSRLRLVALSHRTHVSSLLWAARRKCLSW